MSRPRIWSPVRSCVWSWVRSRSCATAAKPGATRAATSTACFSFMDCSFGKRPVGLILGAVARADLTCINRRACPARRESGMAEYPSQLASERRLADGQRVLIRPVRSDDQAGEDAFLGHLSGDARRRRFMRYAPATDGELPRFFTPIDYDRAMAFVCE